MKDFIKKWWVIPASILLIFPVTIFQLMFLWIFLSFINQELLGYIISCLMGGCAASFPIVFRIWNSEIKTKNAKIIFSFLAIVLFAFILFLQNVNFR